MKPTIAKDDYLKVIYKLELSQDIVTTSGIADVMSVSMASASNMVKKLAQEGYLEHEPYKGVRLTPTGENYIVKLVRRHRLLELFLTRILKMDWDKVDAEAERLEHVISDELENRIDELLGFPETDPHGDPIPKSDGTIIQSKLVNLSELTVGDQAMVSRVNDSNPAILRYLNQLGLIPNTQIEIIRKEPFNGPILIKINDTNEYPIGPEVASMIYVENIKETAKSSITH